MMALEFPWINKVKNVQDVGWRKKGRVLKLNVGAPVN